MKSGLAFAFALVLGAAACASPDAPAVDEVMKTVPKAEKPGLYRLAVGPLAVDPAAALRPAQAEETWSPVPFEPADLRREIEKAVVASGAFADVKFLDALADREQLKPEQASGSVTGAAAAPGAAEEAAGKEKEPVAAKDAVLEGAKPGAPAFRVPEPPAGDEVLQAAFDARADLVLSLAVRRHAVRYVGTNNWYILDLAAFGILIWPAWFIASERYAGEIEMEATIRAVGSEKPVFTRVYRVAYKIAKDGEKTGEKAGAETEAEEADAAQDLNHFDRGFKLAGTLTVPNGFIFDIGELTIENYAKAGETVLPYARNAIARRLARDLVECRREMDEARFQGDLVHALALCVGVARMKAVPDLRYATDDAPSMRALLEDPARGGLAKRNVVTLTDAQATKQAILDRLEERAARAGPRDTLFFYFAGYGFEAGGEAYLVPHDLDPAKPLATAVSLGEVAKRLAACKARQVVILDTSFGAEAGRGLSVRTLRRELLTGLGPAELASAPGAGTRAALQRFAKGRALLVAAAPGNDATELSPIPEDKKGLFTARLLDAAALPSADADKSGWLSVAEVFDVARREAARLSARAGFTQSPELLAEGVDPKQVRLVSLSGLRRGRIAPLELPPSGPAPSDAAPSAAPRGSGNPRDGRPEKKP